MYKIFKVITIDLKLYKNCSLDDFIYKNVNMDNLSSLYLCENTTLYIELIFNNYAFGYFFLQNCA
jgi:hypothetical protein